MVAIGVMLSYFINCQFRRSLILIPNSPSVELVGVSINIVDGPRIWRIPFGKNSRWIDELFCLTSL